MGAASLRSVIGFLLFLFWILILARVVVSWVDPRGYRPASRMVIAWTEPVLGPIRRLLPATGNLDLAPFIVAIVLSVAMGAVGV